MNPVMNPVLPDRPYHEGFMREAIEMVRWFSVCRLTGLQFGSYLAFFWSFSWLCTESTFLSHELHTLLYASGSVSSVALDQSLCKTPWRKLTRCFTGRTRPPIRRDARRLRLCAQRQDHLARHERHERDSERESPAPVKSSTLNHSISINRP